MSYELYDRLTREMQYLTDLQANESERSNVLSVSCFLEDLVREILNRLSHVPKERVIPPKRNGHKPAKNTFEWRIVEIGERNLLPEDVLLDIDLIREIRNLFGHTLAVRSLQHDARAWCERLTTPDKAGEARESRPEGRARHRFDVAALRTIQACVSVIFRDEDRLRRAERERREREMAARRAEEGEQA